MKISKPVLAAILLSAGTAATAQSASDARCIVLSSAFARAGPDAQGRQLAQDALYFYLGRVGPSTSAAQLKTQLNQQMATINDQNDGPLMGECVRNFQAVVERLGGAATPAKPGAKPAQPQGR